MSTRTAGGAASGLSQEQLASRVLEVLAKVGGDEAAGAATVTHFRGQAAIRVPAEHALDVLRRLKEEADLSFEMLTDVTCVHFPRRPAPLGPFDVVYHLTSLTRKHQVRLKVACPDPDAGVDSACSVWEGANFLEREAYDMFGVRFRGHPDLRRILMDESFDGWPLRKDFPYRGH